MASLRWYYPVQVHAVGGGCRPLSPVPRAPAFTAGVVACPLRPTAFASKGQGPLRGLLRKQFRDEDGGVRRGKWSDVSFAGERGHAAVLSPAARRGYRIA